MHECGNWDWDPDIPFLGIFVSKFRYFVFAVRDRASFLIIIFPLEWPPLAVFFYTTNRLHLFLRKDKYIRRLRVRPWMKELKGIIHGGEGAFLRCPVSTSVQFSLRDEGSTEYMCVRGKITGDINIYSVRSTRLHSSVPLLEPGTPRLLVVCKNE
jgi:hypothetical protein